MLGCAVESPGDHLRLGRDARAVTIAGTEFNGTPRIVNDCGSGRVTISSEAVPAVKLPAIARPADRRLQPSKPLLFMVAARPRANTQALEGDDTGAIQAALDQAGKAGGGVVLLPAGVYSLRGHLTVPSGVELRGVCEVEHHSRAWGTVVRVYAGRGEANGAPAIAMAANSGLRGLTFYYPEQRYEAIVPYPFLVQGRGAGIWVVNVTGTNPYQFLDFRTCRCDRHHIEYAAGAPLLAGVAVGGGSVGGEVLNVQFNPHYWAWCPFPDCPGVSNDELAHHLNPVWAYQYQNLEGFVFGDCQDEYQFENAVFGSRIGLHFVSENGTGAAGVVLGHGTDGSMVSMAFDGLGPKGVDVLNSQLVAMDAAGVPSTTEKTYVRCGANLRSTARLVNTTLWGYPVNAVVVHGGTLDMDMSGFRMYGPLLVDGGQLNVAASLFVQQMTGVRELAVSGEGKASLLGNLAPQGMRANPDAPAGSVEERLGNRRP